MVSTDNASRRFNNFKAYPALQTNGELSFITQRHEVSWPMIMKKQWKTLLSILALSIVVTGNSAANDAEEKTISPQPNQTSKRIIVVEVFWYGCSRCYSFEPHIEKWLTEKANYIEFVRIPAASAKNWRPHARAYYVAEKLNAVEKIHRPLYDAIHKENRKIFDKKGLRNFFAEQGIDVEKFDKLYSSREITMQLDNSYAFAQKYGINGVPALIVHGKYGMGAKDSGSYSKTFDVINELAAKEYESLTNNN